MLKRYSTYLTALLVCLFVVTGCAAKKTKPYKVNTFALESGRYGEGLANDGDNIYVFGGSGKGGLLGDVEIIDPENKNIQVLKNHVIPRRYFSAVYDDNHSIYLIGGISGTVEDAKYESRVEVFNTKTRKVTLAAPLPYPTRINSAVHLNGKIYVVGGSHRDWETRKMKRTSLMAVYDIATNQWSLAPPMPTEKATYAVTHDNKIYVVGGFNGEEALTAFERFDPATNEWETLEPLPLTLSAHSAAVWQNSLFTFGDYEDMGSTYVYNFESQKWKQVKLNFQPARHSKATTLNNTVYVIGGNVATQGSHLNYIQVFDSKALKKAAK
ncbi:kelch repeat-containing protein [Alteromonas pelagimontana]|uniref:Kelch repeat-containing protein n=1 Tax=Alteromonas pelagimontana TaxID=1858656 RepID=A0A6M4MCK4_9ALTE|nr:kelch repeat-containing protein [Alteromonas pelagimontana]QJR80881.1 kelch repeat-containing protein [Alteromonas pelagimontana]